MVLTVAMTLVALVVVTFVVVVAAVPTGVVAAGVVAGVVVGVFLRRGSCRRGAGRRRPGACEQEPQREDGCGRDRDDARRTGLPRDLVTGWVRRLGLPVGC